MRKLDLLKAGIACVGAGIAVIGAKTGDDLLLLGGIAIAAGQGLSLIGERKNHKTLETIGDVVSIGGSAVALIDTVMKVMKR